LKYVSTRGLAPELDFEDVLLAGLAKDGGLYVPASWPRLDPDEIAQLAGRPYQEVAAKVLWPFVGTSMPPADLKEIIDKAYATFDDGAVTPLVQLEDNHWLLELFHGPTLSFKDIALQLLGHLFGYVLAKRQARMTVVGATSGDTGSAAIEALRNRAAVSIFILHPYGRVSDVQRRQMTTVLDSNVHNIAIEGTFDDCQALVKAMFRDEHYRQSIHMAAVNSINWARIMAQAVYYFHSAVALGAPEKKVAFSVPTGNFGDVFAGYVAAQMGLPIERLIIGTNVNDILVRVMKTKKYQVAEVTHTSSPAMDIQVSSNFERLLFDAYGRNGAAIRALMDSLSTEGCFDVSENALGSIRDAFRVRRIDENHTRDTIKSIHDATGRFIDPHTAVAIAAARQERPAQHVPLVSLATAHPAKFPEAVIDSTGLEPPLPARLSDLLQREERYDVLPNDLNTIKSYILQRF